MMREQARARVTAVEPPCFDAAAVPPAGETEVAVGALASLWLHSAARLAEAPGAVDETPSAGASALEARYRTLLDQIPAIVFVASLDGSSGETDVSAQLESQLGFSRSEWRDPGRWYRQLHADDRSRWNLQVAEMLTSGTPLRSNFRVVARDGRVVWFHCEARLVRNADGRPWFIQGVAFDISAVKEAEAALEQERRVRAEILDTVGVLIAVLHPDGRIARLNRTCETASGSTSEKLANRRFCDLLGGAEDADAFNDMLAETQAGGRDVRVDTWWKTADGLRRISWSASVIARHDGSMEFIIATGTDITERRRLQKTILEIGDVERRRIGQDLHDGLGQHLTGIACMSRVLEDKLMDRGVPESGDAHKIVGLVNDAIDKTRELSRGLLLVAAEQGGLVAALRQISADMEDLFGITCRLECNGTVPVDDPQTVKHLCQIVREAANNAIRHGHARQITVGLSRDGSSGVLAVLDDGTGFPSEVTGPGMGLHIMRYRAGVIGGALQLGRNGCGQTTVTCRFPVRRVRPRMRDAV